MVKPSAPRKRTPHSRVRRSHRGASTALLLIAIAALAHGDLSAAVGALAAWGVLGRER